VSHASNYIQVRGYGNSSQYFQVYDSKASAIRMQLGLDTGYVGFGTSTLNQIFEVTGTKNDAWAGKFTNANPGGYGGLFIISGSTANDYAFEIRTGTSDTVMKVLGTGNVGIGTTNPSTLLDIYSSTIPKQRFTNSSMYWEMGITSPNDFTLSDNSGEALKIYNGSSKIWSITGDVGIGTTNPAQALHIYRDGDLFDSTTRLRVQDAGTNNQAILELVNDSRAFHIKVDGANQTEDLFKIYDSTAGADRLVIDTSGSIGIGTTNPGQLVEIYSASGDPKLQITRATRSSYFAQGSSGGYLQMYDAGGTLGSMFRSYGDSFMLNNLVLGATTGIERLTLDGTNPRIFLDDSTAPGTTTNRLYAVAGQLYWNGVGLTVAGSLPSPIEGNVMRGNGVTSWQTTSDLYIASSSGYVGIGSTNPTVALDVNGGTSQVIGIFRSTDAGSVIQLYDDAGAVANIGVSNGVAKFGARSIISNDDFSITTTGLVGIGTTNPAQKLHTYTATSGESVYTLVESAHASN
jgi:hypothetical protein